MGWKVSVIFFKFEEEDKAQANLAAREAKFSPAKTYIGESELRT